MLCSKFLGFFLGRLLSLVAGLPKVKDAIVKIVIVIFVSYILILPASKRLLPLVIPGLLLAIVVGCTFIDAPSLCLRDDEDVPAVAKKVLNCPSVCILSNLFLNLNKFS